jgi:hypothetical protein
MKQEELLSWEGHKIEFRIESLSSEGILTRSSRGWKIDCTVPSSARFSPIVLSEAMVREITVENGVLHLNYPHFITVQKRED